MNTPHGGRLRPLSSSYHASSATPSSVGGGHVQPDESGNGMIQVRDARRVLECFQTLTQIRFQRLVRHYLSQILYGCTSASCHTPTCLSCQKRNASKPHRPPTQLTARALAHFLASHDNTRAKLCPHELKVSPDHVQFDVVDEVVSRHKQVTHDGQFEVYPSLEQMAQAHRCATTFEVMNGASLAMLAEKPNVVDAFDKRRQQKKDAKSLAQNLYDTVTMIFYLSRRLPETSSLLHHLDFPDDNDRGVAYLQLDDESHASTIKRTDGHARDSQSCVQTNGYAITNGSDVPVTMHVREPERDLGCDSVSNADTDLVKVVNHDQTPFDASLPFANNTVVEAGSDRLETSRTERPSGTMRQLRSKSDKSKGDSIATDYAVLETSQARLDGEKHGHLSSADSLSSGPSLGVLPSLNCDHLDAFKEDVLSHRKDQPVIPAFTVDYNSDHRFRPTTSSVNRSLFYTLSDAGTLLESFRDVNPAFASSPLSHLNSSRLINSFRDWNHRNGALVFDSLCIALDALFVPPSDLEPKSKTNLKAQNRQGHPSKKHIGLDTSYLKTVEAAHIVMICIHALTSSVSVGWPHTWVQVRHLRSWGVIVPSVVPNTDKFAHPFMDIIDDLEYEPAVRLAEKLLRAIGTRACHEHILKSRGFSEERMPIDGSSKGSLTSMIVEHLMLVEEVFLSSKRRFKTDQKPSDDPGWTVTATLLEWMKTVIIKNWDGKAAIKKWGCVGAAIMLMDSFHVKGAYLNVRTSMFEMPYVHEKLDALEEPMAFLNWGKQLNTLHILEYPQLFTQQQLVGYFRTINFSKMMEQYNHTIRTQQLMRSLEMFLQMGHNRMIQDRMSVTLTEVFVLNVSRAEPLKDTLDQLWKQEKRMLLKPLKVQMGQAEGEVGQDLGGVTNEFFHIVFNEAFAPEHGMFTIDPRTRMTWFQPHSIEPLWKFEMIGILFSLAVYNGVTLPVTFPLIFYCTLLMSEKTLSNRRQHFATNHLKTIKDGWPDLHKGFASLLSWEDGDVGDVMMREYAFSFELYGQKYDHNMAYDFPSSSATFSEQSEPVLVTNANRAQFVDDYIYHLTYASVLPQLQAFMRGFLTCLSERSLTFFSPLSLRNLVEGSQHISVSSLRRVTKYEDGYHDQHPVIQTFWSIVQTYDQENCRRLLEFVTASDRVPVTGYESIVFVIVRLERCNMLPSSSTCFGKLYLPEYHGTGVMKKKLGLALQHSRGFGVA